MKTQFASAVAFVALVCAAGQGIAAPARSASQGAMPAAQSAPGASTPGVSTPGASTPGSPAQGTSAPGAPQQKQPAQGQPQQPAGGDQGDDTLQLGGELVTVPFNVSDKHNALIADVKQNEVQILEDGAAQEVFSFERLTETPLSIALLVDTSGSEIEGIPAEREAATRFFAKVLRPEKDIAAVATFAKEVTLEQELTNNPAALTRALDRARVNPATVYSPAGTPPLNSSAGGTSIWDAVYLASGDVLRGEAGRRVIILLTDGYDTTSSYKIEQAIERAWRSEVIVYAIGIAGSGYPINGGPLDKITKETGGRYFQPRNFGDLDKAFDEIQNDLRTQYVLTYTPTNEAHDGTFRKIEVKLLGDARKNLRVRYRRGYYAPAPGQKRQAS